MSFIVRQAAFTVARPRLLLQIALYLTTPYTIIAPLYPTLFALPKVCPEFAVGVELLPPVDHACGTSSLAMANGAPVRYL